jgi:hypothetical protein
LAFWLFCWFEDVPRWFMVKSLIFLDGMAILFWWFSVVWICLSISEPDPNRPWVADCLGKNDCLDFLWFFE